MIVFIHSKSWIALAIRDLLWIKIKSHTPGTQRVNRADGAPSRFHTLAGLIADNLE